MRIKDDDKYNLKVSPKIEEMLDDLINKFGMNTKILSKALRVESSIIDNYSKYEDTMSMGKYGPFKGLLATLYSIPEINPDERNKAVISYLTKIHHIDIATIANFAHVKIKDIYDFMKDSNSVSFEVKYKISSVSMFLHFLFKPEEDAQ
ncbi:MULTISPECIES: HTH domain-containing protein [unclassified Clostridium]|uniref:HTH domain-containing protein n=1 Tax=unclassified Clostridium TaxID=2614128 RepID=UPI00023B05AD|nr:MULTISPECIES: HTH domain-containing protein [unclassified Clostridium]EHJ00881.1 hypothetical protein CDLVIII_4369 [Clostridium sp. DL-VIII]OOM80935.1 hypothetical protein CLOBL_05340 [Clostridium sp. BL-8]